MSMEQRNDPTDEEELDECFRCRKPIDKYEGICAECYEDSMREQEAFQERIQERGGLDG